MQGLRHNGAAVLDSSGRPIVTPKKVLISVVSGEIVYADFAIGLAAMCNTPGALIALCNNKVEPDSGTSSIAFNNSIETARQLGVEYILFLGPDVIVRPDTLRKLLAHDLPVIGAVYPRSMQPFNIKEAPDQTRPAGLVPDWVSFCESVRAQGVKIYADLELSAEVTHGGTNQYQIQREPPDPPPAELPHGDEPTRPAAANA